MVTPIIRDRLDGSSGYFTDRWAYTAGNLIEYHGVAFKGSLTSENAWLIEKWTYDGSNNAILRQTSEASIKWDDRGSASYS